MNTYTNTVKINLNKLPPTFSNSIYFRIRWTIPKTDNCFIIINTMTFFIFLHRSDYEWKSDSFIFLKWNINTCTISSLSKFCRWEVCTSCSDFNTWIIWLWITRNNSCSCIWKITCRKVKFNNLSTSSLISIKWLVRNYTSCSASNFQWSCCSIVWPTRTCIPQKSCKCRIKVSNFWMPLCRICFTIWTILCSKINRWTRSSIHRNIWLAYYNIIFCRSKNICTILSIVNINIHFIFTYSIKCICPSLSNSINIKSINYSFNSSSNIFKNKVYSTCRIYLIS